MACNTQTMFRDLLKGLFDETVKKDKKALDRRGLDILLFKAGYTQVGKKSEDFLNLVDTDKTGTVSFDELYAALNKADPDGTGRATALIRYKFKQLDKDGSGKLTSSEVYAWLDSEGKDQKDIFGDVGARIKQFDQDGDGKVDVEEFLAGYQAALGAKVKEQQQKLPPAFEARMKSLFDQFDTRKDGKITDFDLMLLMKKAGIQDADTHKFKQAQSWHEAMDKDNDKFVSWDELKAALSEVDPTGKIRTEADLRFAFMKLDKDSSGDVDADELRGALGEKPKPHFLTIDGVKESLQYHIDNGDKKINYEEFIDAWRMCSM